MNNYPQVISMYPTGSRFTCNPPVMDTDIDYLILVERDSYEFDDYLEKLGFVTNYLDYPMQEFRSWKKEELNYIITDDVVFYDNMKKATQLAKKLNLLDKQQRIDCFDYVMYGTI